MSLQTILVSNIKVIILVKIFFLISLVSSYADFDIRKFNPNNWDQVCSSKDKKNCIIGIKNEFKRTDNGKIQTIGTAYIQIGTSSKKKLDLVNKQEQTYKLGEATTKVPVLIVNVPLGTDLRQKPLIKVDETNLANSDYLHCDNFIGCKTMIVLTDEGINYFKKGNVLSVFIKVVGREQAYIIKFPLKNFAKSFNKLIKS